ncbi:long-chain fatty acid--CoA ligase, partial [Rhodopseudomonas sp. BR0C11]|uniref:AMP-binding protein n=1 Tax=Rhodopseudomonas sp. BR0C11 TaxID=2269370 RepID=UPI0013DEE1F5
MSFAYFDWIAHHAEVRPERIAVVDLTTSRNISYRAMDERVDRLAAHLATLGVGRGDRVAVLALNAVETLEVQFACFRLGAIFVPLNVRLTVHELSYIVGDAAPRVLAHDDELAPMAAELKAACGVPHLLAFGPAYEA